VTGPRQVGLVAADSVVPTRMTVNGTPVELAVPARITLADVLRDQLGLTGTHIGCEHGVCGMCTVLVDGNAARSCLMFACQADGAEVTTVEGLGSAAELHPLQESFGSHHALQCGFCTPGFLMSAYDLLRHDPGVEPGELPGELSGVICRCTGYRNIVAAVAAVADRYRPGTGEDERPALPPPLNCGPRAGTDSAQPAVPGGGHPERIALPDSEPTITVSLRRKLPVPLQDVARILGDVNLLAQCLPGAELTGALGDDWYQGRIRVSLGPLRLAFTGVAHIVERDDGRIRVLAQGGDPASGQAQAEISLIAAPEGGGSALTATARLYLTGRIASFGRSLSRDVAAHMFTEFTAAVDRAVSGPRPETRRLSVFRLITLTVIRRFRNVMAAVRGHTERQSES
jgi:carbon-monoxide dehydrogenase small subunit